MDLLAKVGHTGYFTRKPKAAVDIMNDIPLEAIPTSGVRILSTLREAGGLSIPALASGSLVSPGKVRTEVIRLKTRGLTEVDPSPSGDVVRITPQGIEFLQVLFKSPGRVAILTEPLSREDLNLDLDSALDEAVRNLPCSVKLTEHE